jgi:hypothetical protein
MLQTAGREEKENKNEDNYACGNITKIKND